MGFNADDYELLPGVPAPKGFSIPNEFFWYFWDKLEEAQIHDKVFYSERIADKNAFTTFMKFMALPIMVINKESKMPVGMGWLTDMAENRAFAHFAFLPDVWGHAAELGKMLQDYCFKVQPLELLLGIVPEWNKYAQSFTERTGGTKLGTIPKVCRKPDGTYESGIMYYLTRET